MAEGMAAAERSGRSRLALVLPGLVVLGAAVVAAVFFLSSGGDDDPAELVEPIDVVSQGPIFDDLDGLVASSDLVVEGTLVAVEAGRPISDPADPDVGVITSLGTLEVSEVFIGDAAEVITVEQEATLLDGAPIMVDGLSANSVGDRGFWFLVRGGSPSFPYVALVNQQARLLVSDDDTLEPSALTTSDDPTHLREQLRQLAATR